MRFGVAIATVGRSDILSSILPQIKSTLRAEDRMVVVGASAADWPTHDVREGVDLIISQKGSTFQRSAAIDHLQGQVDVIVFFDDDFIPASDWLDSAERLLTEHTDVVAFTGHVVADGIHGPGFSPDQGKQMLAADIDSTHQRDTIDEDIPSYGCNMGYRLSAIGDQRFDHRLRLYAWQEDADFSSRVASNQRRVRFNTLRGVHLGVKSGRVAGKKLGYAQIMNPVYLMRKGTMPASHALPLMAKNIIANMVKSLRPEPWVDRRGRLVGNLKAFADLCLGHLEPERIEQV